MPRSGSSRSAPNVHQDWPSFEYAHNVDPNIAIPSTRSKVSGQVLTTPFAVAIAIQISEALLVLGSMTWKAVRADS